MDHPAQTISRTLVMLAALAALCLVTSPGQLLGLAALAAGAVVAFALQLGAAARAQQLANRETQRLITSTTIQHMIEMVTPLLLRSRGPRPRRRHVEHVQTEPESDPEDDGADVITFAPLASRALPNN